MRGAALALVAALCGCVSYRPPPPLSAHADPTGVMPIYVKPELATSAESVPARPLTPNKLAGLLHAAGFEPVFVSADEDVPPGAPSVARATNESGDCTEEGTWIWTLLWDLTLGLVPQYWCVQTGYRFELQRAPSAPIQEIDTRAQVPMILGWLAIPLGYSKGYTAGWFFPPSEYWDWDERQVPAVRAALLDALEVRSP